MRYRVVLIISIATTIACGDSAQDAQVPGDNPDAGTAECVRAAEIGHCIDEATGEPCLDFGASIRQFLPLDPSTVVRPIVGPQGADMFVLALRCRGINPGTAEDSPWVEISVYASDEERGGYNSFPEFMPDATLSGAFVAPQLYTAVFDIPEGESVRVVGEATDSTGNRFCAEATFVTGSLIERDPGHH